MLLITRQLLANIKEVVIPFIMGRLNMVRIIMSASSNMDMGQRASHLGRAFSRMCTIHLNELHMAYDTESESEGSRSGGGSGTDDDISSSDSSSSFSVAQLRRFGCLGPSTFWDLVTMAQVQLWRIVSSVGGRLQSIRGSVTQGFGRKHARDDFTLTQVEVESNMQSVGRITWFSYVIWLRYGETFTPTFHFGYFVTGCSLWKF